MLPAIGGRVVDPMGVPAVATVAFEVLTTRQRETWRLESLGMSSYAIAQAQGISRASVRTTLFAAHQKLRRAGVRCSSEGVWFVKTEGRPVSDG